jgi:hypothetical protein
MKSNLAAAVAALDAGTRADVVHTTYQSPASRRDVLQIADRFQSSRVTKDDLLDTNGTGNVTPLGVDSGLHSAANIGTEYAWSGLAHPRLASLTEPSPTWKRLDAVARLMDTHVALLTE